MAVSFRQFSWLSNNLSYKIVALFIAMILWLTILGRRDFVLTRDIAIEYMAGSEYSVASSSHQQITLKISGSRQALNRFSENYQNQSVPINLESRGVGRFDLKVPVEKLDLPFGVKLVSVKPKSVQVMVVPKNEEQDED